jgi:putative addiction module component (TIGR02574 family)
MTATVERIRHEANQLPYDERETLIRALELDLDSTTPDGDSPVEIEAAWDAEIETRVADIESGKVKLLSRAEFNTAFTEARQKLAAKG